MRQNKKPSAPLNGKILLLTLRVITKKRCAWQLVPRQVYFSIFESPKGTQARGMGKSQKVKVCRFLYGAREVPTVAS